MHTEQHFAFKANYFVDTEVELPPAGGSIVAFAREGDNPNTGLGDGLLCMISPDGHKEWLASFKAGHKSPGDVHGIFSTPNPELMCVVVGGMGYWLNVIKKTKSDIECFPIRQVKIIEEFNLLVFVDFTRLAAYGFNGLKWCSDRLVLDELRIVDRNSSILICEGLDDTASSTMQFKVDLFSGSKRE